MESYDIHEEPIGETYECLIAWLLDRAEAFELDNPQPIVRELRQAGVEPVRGLLNPDSRASSVAPRYRFCAGHNAGPVLARAERLYSVENLGFFRDAVGSKPLLETISHEKDGWLVLADREREDLQRAIPGLQLAKPQPLPAHWEVKATISARVPDEPAGRQVAREIRAFVSAGSAQLLRSVFIGDPDQLERGRCVLDVEAAGTRAAVRRLELQIITAVTAAGGRFDETNVWDTRAPGA